MKKSVEFMKELEEVQAKIKNLADQQKYTEAAELADHVQELKNKVKEAEEMENNFTPINNFQQTAVKKDGKIENRILNKMLLNRALTEGEKEYLNATKCIKDAAGTPGAVGATPDKGGYLLPDEHIAQIFEYRRGFTQLKNLCTVRVASTMHGSMPAVGAPEDALINFEELTEINQNDIDFSQIKYDIKSYGEIIPVSSELLNDTDIDLVGLIGRRFAQKAINAENKKILEIAKTAEVVEGKTVAMINKALNKVLDPEISAVAQIITNQSGFDYLDSLTDKNDRPLLTVSLADPTQKLYKGRPIVVLKDTVLPNEADNTFPFYVGSLADFVNFFERQGVEVATSYEAGFSKNAVLFRCIERFDVAKADAKAMTLVKITPTTTATT